MLVMQNSIDNPARELRTASISDRLIYWVISGQLFH